MQRGRAFERRGASSTYRFQQQQQQHSTTSNGVTHSQQKTRVMESSSRTPAERPLGSGGDEIDSALNDLMIVSQMANSSTPVAENSNGKKSVRMAESHSASHQHVSTGPIVTPGPSGSTSVTSRQFYSFSSSSSKQQVVSSSSGGTIEIPASPAPTKRIESSTSATSNQSKTVTSASSNSTSLNKVDYSRINQNIAGTDSLTRQQLDSPVCNFQVNLFITIRLELIRVSTQFHFYPTGSSRLSKVSY